MEEEIGFVPGASVITNDKYFEKKQVRVEGYIIEPKGVTITDNQVIVRWISQKGPGFDSYMDKQMVLMYKDDLILTVSH